MVKFIVKLEASPPKGDAPIRINEPQQGISSGKASFTSFYRDLFAEAIFHRSRIPPRDVFSDLQVLHK
jgi:hypothetical protein